MDKQLLLAFIIGGFIACIISILQHKHYKKNLVSYMEKGIPVCIKGKLIRLVPEEEYVEMNKKVNMPMSAIYTNDTSWIQRLNKSAKEPLIFRYGRSYQHNDGHVITIIGAAHTNVYGNSLIAEDDYGNLIPVGQEEWNTINYHEVPRPQKTDTSSTLPDGMRYLNKQLSRQPVVLNEMDAYAKGKGLK